LTICLGGALTVVGTLHIVRAERLGFADLSGPVEYPTLPRLHGLATPGSYVSDFEALLRRTRELIPPGDTVVTIPGEDPFYFAAKRRPRFPIIVFDDTAVPYDAKTLLEMLEDREVKWIVVKTRLQLLNPPWRPLDTFLGSLAARYAVADTLPRYTILKRR
jgi:hypothetical protein